MRPISYDVLTPEDHSRCAQSLLDLRRRVAVITRVLLSGRVPTSVLDAALKVEHELATLCLRLADDVGDGPAAGAYTLESPQIENVPAATGRMSAEEHRALGLELDRLRSVVMELTCGLGGHYAKSSGVGRALHRPESAIDRLRCKLDDLFCHQHRELFDPCFYYPGAAPPLPAAESRAKGGGR